MVKSLNAALDFSFGAWYGAKVIGALVSSQSRVLITEAGFSNPLVGSAETRAGRLFLPVVPLFSQESEVSTILLVVLILLLIGAFPTWSYSNQWGYGPSGGVGVALVVVLVLVLLGRL